MDQQQIFAMIGVVIVGGRVLYPVGWSRFSIWARGILGW